MSGARPETDLQPPAPLPAPADEVIVLAVEHVPDAVLGVVHAGFGTEADAQQARMLRRLARAESTPPHTAASTRSPATPTGREQP